MVSICCVTLRLVQRVPVVSSVEIVFVAMAFLNQHELIGCSSRQDDRKHVKIKIDCNEEVDKMGKFLKLRREENIKN